MALVRHIKPPQGFGGLQGRRSQRPVLRCQAAAHDGSGSNPPVNERPEPQALRGATLLLAAALTAQAAAPPAAAARGVSWEPRRHYRRLPRLVPDLEVTYAPQSSIRSPNCHWLEL